MAERINPLLVFGLFAAVGVYLMSKTQTGQSVIRAAVDASAEAASTVAQVFTGPRGIRNNNPGNIVRVPGTTWLGMSSDQSADPRFVVFDSPEWGIRAMARVLKNYIAGGYNTVQAIINRWAPPSENVTSAYVTAVANSIGISPYAQVDASYIPALVAAITQHENGQQPYPPDLIALGVQMETTT